MDIVLDQLNSGSVLAGMSRLNGLLARARRQLSGQPWKRFVETEVRRHPVLDVVHEDPLTYRAFAKPRGYAGDAVMMDYIYGYRLAEIEELPERPRRVFSYCTSSASAEAVKFRRRVLAETIDAEAKRRRRDIDVVAIAAGHLREVDLSEAVRNKQASVTAFDQDEESLALVESDYGRYGVKAVPASVRHIIAGRTPLPTSDLSYTAGLYDYLPQSAAERLTAIMFKALRPGGTLLLANFLPGILDLGYMESCMDWHLIYRDDEQMRALMAAVPVGEIASIDQFHDPFDNITFLRATKRAWARG